MGTHVHQHDGEEMIVHLDILFIQHHDASRRNQRRPEEGLQTHGFLQEDEGEADGDYHAELVYRSHTAHVAHLYRLEIEQPREARGAAREQEEEPRMTGNGLDLHLMVTHNYDTPGNEEDNGGTDGRGQVGINVFHTHLGEDCRQSGKEC